MTAIRRMKHKQAVDADAVLRRLAAIRSEAKEVRKGIRATSTVASQNAHEGSQIAHERAATAG